MSCIHQIISNNFTIGPVHYLIKEGKAYVDSQSSEAMAEQKGTPTQPGVDGPYRNRTVAENLDLFERMKQWRI